MGCVLREFLSSTYFKYASDKNPCAALPIEKIPHLGTENSVFKILFIKHLNNFKF
jgi:hypothetical protein